MVTCRSRHIGGPQTCIASKHLPGQVNPSAPPAGQIECVRQIKVLNCITKLTCSLLKYRTVEYEWGRVLM